MSVYDKYILFINVYDKDGVEIYNFCDYEEDLVFNDKEYKGIDIRGTAPASKFTLGTYLPLQIKGLPAYTYDLVGHKIRFMVVYIDDEGKQTIENNILTKVVHSESGITYHCEMINDNLKTNQ